MEKQHKRYDSVWDTKITIATACGKYYFFKFWFITQ